MHFFPVQTYTSVDWEKNQAASYTKFNPGIYDEFIYVVKKALWHIYN